jgi:hypothetical protein
MGAALLFISNGNIAYPVLAQVLAILLLTFSVYVAIAFLLREYTYSIEPNKHIVKDDSMSEQYDFIITEAKGKRNVKVCHIEISDIKFIRVVDPTNRKQIKSERKNMKRFTYDTDFAASRQIELVAEIDGEEYSIIFSYDEELLRVFKNIFNLVK